MNHQPTTPTKVFPQVVPINFEKNPNQSYCQLTIPPKIEKLKQKHAELLA
jgi:hypothetical protein